VCRSLDERQKSEPLWTFTSLETVSASEPPAPTAELLAFLALAMLGKIPVAPPDLLPGFAQGGGRHSRREDGSAGSSGAVVRPPTRPE
jgi:hypothetical protein